MSDEYQVKAIRTQSTAVVSAALITTIGAVTAACIQSGWISKPIETSALSQPLASTARTTFMEPDRTFKIPVLPPQQPATRVTAERPIIDARSTVLQAGSSTRRPATPDASWSASMNPLAQDARPQVKKSTKFWDWSAMTRFLFGQN
jgi:hypothetical protein